MSAGEGRLEPRRRLGLGQQKEALGSVVELRVPIALELVWAHVMRPRLPLVYLDLNHIIAIARVATRHKAAEPRYARLLASASRAAAEHRAVFPLGESHVWEILKIADPKQRRALVDVLEPLTGFQYMLGRATLAELEVEAGLAALRGRQPGPLDYYPLVRPTIGNAFGVVGGLKIVDVRGEDVTESTRRAIGSAVFDERMAKVGAEFERLALRGPDDADLADLRSSYGYEPEVALASHESRVEFERDTALRLDEHPEWRRGRLRDFIAAREFIHEWLDMINRVLARRGAANGAASALSEDEMRALMGAMPHAQVAISLKTRYHQNARHEWTANDITDIDSLSAAFAYCDAVLTDKAARSALLAARDLRQFKTLVPRDALELADWLDALPIVAARDVLVPHPGSRALR